MRASNKPVVGRLLALVLCAAAVSACNGGNKSASAPGPDVPGPGTVTGRTFMIVPDATATTKVQEAMIGALPGDVIQFGCGFFEINRTLQLTNVEDVRIKGCGKDRTVLSFRDNQAPEGLLAVNSRGITIEDLTVLDTGGNGIEFRGVDHGTVRRVRTIWSSGGGRSSNTPITKDNAFADEAKLLNVKCTNPPTLNPTVQENMFPGADTSSPDYTVSPSSGRYGIYPVSSENILIEEAESIGASDAGIYVGQTNTAIIRNSRAAYNVFGFEIENVVGGEYQNNIAECNTGGFLVYDLDNLRQYGDRSRMYGNISRNNNTYNFTAGGFVANVPPGSGMITLSYDRIDIFDNEFRDNNTGGILHASYELFPEGAGRPTERRIDWYTEGVHIYRNKFFNNGNGLPRPTTKDLQNGDFARILPVLVGLKNQAACLNPLNAAACVSVGSTPPNPSGYRGAHIVWDGLLDAYDPDCPYPKDANGEPVPQDARGKPLHNNEHPDPACHYNAYKFASTAPNGRLNPDWFASCIDDDNVYSNDSIKFSNFNGLRGLEAVIAAALVIDPTDPATYPAAFLAALTALPSSDLRNFASSFDLGPHQCTARYGSNLPPLEPVVIPPFVRSGTFDPAPSEALVTQLCGAEVAAGQVNFDAARVNCPTLDQYRLFADPEDPTSAPNGGGVPYSMNTKLFSDYSVKYRVAWLPPGTKAVYRDAATDGANATIVFPAGTIIAKTFSFRNETAGTEVPMETRLLIKRVNSKGAARWDGLPYIWQTVDGKRVAKLSLIGAEGMSAAWDVIDVDSNKRETDSTDDYLIPNVNQCLSCHSNADKEPGSAPIGTKVRFLNGPYRSESQAVTGQSQHPVSSQNQIQYWCQQGLLAGCPENLGVNAALIATQLERVPIFNKPGDSGFEAGSDQDIEARARAYLEVNCAHCHNVQGFAANTGYYLDSLRRVDQTYGICKGPTATGNSGSGGRTVDIHPGNALRSILEFRISPSATTDAARMPPLARSVVHTEGHALIAQWINNVVVADEAKYPNSTACTGG